MVARAQRISKLNALCNKTASAVQQLKDEVRRGNFDLEKPTASSIGTQPTRSQTTAANYKIKGTLKK